MKTTVIVVPPGYKMMEQYFFWYLYSFLVLVFAVAEETQNAKNRDSYLQNLKGYDDGLWMLGLDSTYSAEDKISFIEEEDHLAQVRPLLRFQEQQRVLHNIPASGSDSSFLEVDASVGKVHNFCEICILIMQMKMRGQPHLCAGMNPDYFITVRLHCIRTSCIILHALAQRRKQSNT